MKTHLMKQNKGILYHQYRSFCILTLACICSLMGFSQENSSHSLKVRKKKNNRPSYIMTSFGLNRSSFRDFATSPLVYSGLPIYVAAGHTEFDERRLSETIFSYSFGNYSNGFNQHYSVSRVNTISYNYIELFQLKKWSNSWFNFKVGGQLNSTVNIRTNEDLFNNGQGFEVISTLFGSVQGTIDVSREEEKKIEFLFLKYVFKKRVQNFSCNINFAAINTSFRNGFAYTNSAATLNKDEFFVDYEFKFFSGYRLNTQLNYTYFVNENNAIQFSYLWDAYTTSGHFDNYEMDAHIFKVSLLFGLK